MAFRTFITVVFKLQTIVSELLLANIFKIVTKNVVLDIDTLGTSEEPSSSISAEWRGASDKRAGDKLKTGPS